jgi:hypothetical protein
VGIRGHDVVVVLAGAGEKESADRDQGT